MDSDHEKSLSPETSDKNVPTTSNSPPEPSPDVVASSKQSRSFMDRLPAWVSANIRSRKSWKVLFRCWLASWVAFIILLPDKSLLTLGNTAFFALLASFFLPAYLPIQMFVIIISTLMIGILSGWGLGIAAMRAANAARNQALLSRVTQEVQQSIASDPVARANPAIALAESIYSGAFLDIRASAVYGCFLGVGAFVFGLIRAYSPKLLFMSIFGTIALDIFCTIGPLIPKAEYTLLKSLAISVSCYTAVAVLVTICVFPQTMNHLCMDMISSQLSRLKALVEIQHDVMNVSPLELAPGSTLIGTITRQRAEVIAGQRQLMSVSGPINLEFSMGRWNGDDVREMEEPLLNLVIRIAGLQTFSKLVGDLSLSSFEEVNESTDSTTTSSTSDSPVTPDSYLIRQLYQRNLTAEKAQNLTITDILPVLKDATRELREACILAIAAAKSTIDFVNTRRWKRHCTLNEENKGALVDALTRLREARLSFKNIQRKHIVTPYIPLLVAAQSRKEKDALPLKALYVSFVFAANLIMVSDSVVEFMEKIQEKVEKRTTNRLWAPKGLRALGKLFVSRGDDRDATLGEDTSLGVPGEDDASDCGWPDEKYRRDPDSKPPTNAIQKIMDHIHKSWKWAKTAEALFTFKYVILTIALWLPAVCKSTAHFYFVQRGVWALIMAQTTLNIYVADQIFNLFSRLLGTLLGLIFGLVAWFIGNGRGNGNPYGAAAIVGVLIVPFIFVRIYSPPQYLGGVILGCVTFALILGYSWVDGHYVQVASPGVGWPVAWKRWALVVIGATASFIIMMLPPTSGRKAVRMRNASSVVVLSNIYAFLISTWIATHPSNPRNAPDPKWILGFRSKLIALGQEIGAIRNLTELARWEGSIRGAWPVEEYLQLVSVQSDMIASLAQLGGALGHLEDGWRLSFIHSTKVLNPYFISDVMSVFALVSHALRTGEPMHHVLPTTLLDRLFYHHHHSIVLPATPEHGSKHLPDVDEVHSLDYMYYAQGLVAVYQLLKSLDELHRITKRLCGEVPLAGFSNWRDEYQRTHIRV